MKIVLVIEGPIGAGKSTLAGIISEVFSSKYSTSVVQEPVDKWIELGALKRAYDDPKKNTFAFQVLAWGTRAQRLRQNFDESPDVEIRIIERSPYSDHLFTKVQVEKGNISAEEYAIYQEYHKGWMYIWPERPTHFIYLVPPVEECEKRIISRDRFNESGECAVSADYQRELIKAHDKMFAEEITQPVLRISDTADYRNPGPERDELIQRISSFLNI